MAQSQLVSEIYAVAKGWVKNPKFYDGKGKDGKGKKMPSLDLLLSVSEHVKLANGDSQDITSTHQVKLFGDIATEFANLNEGDAIAVEGRLHRTRRRDGDDFVNDTLGHAIYDTRISLDDDQGRIEIIDLGPMPERAPRTDASDQSGAGGQSRGRSQAQDRGQSSAGGHSRGSSQAGSGQAGSGQAGGSQAGSSQAQGRAASSGRGQSQGRGGQQSKRGTR